MRLVNELTAFHIDGRYFGLARSIWALSQAACML